MLSRVAFHNGRCDLLQYADTRRDLSVWSIRRTRWYGIGANIGCEVSRFTAKHFVYELMNNERFKKGDA
jgi:hypothetical protein